MLEPTKKQTTDEFAELCFRVPAVHADRIRAVVDNILALIGGKDQGVLPNEGQDEEDRLYSIEEVFPDFHPGDTLKGARLMHELTQAQLAAMIGVKASHISEMEKGKRPIGKEMARRLGKALNTSYQVFL
ncbi:MAG: helix-turn-helix transcriptional regulator [Deltaproteobacteria bacterium]|nr:helix-turn-helix transcriptional regulator [Deltaproteobacteria bacterium]MBI4795881.1 helix-turn-helix transcriptional regulator [Deltaproteobacteria bacterium]